MQRFLQLVLLCVVLHETSFALKIQIHHFNDISGQIQQIRKGFDPSSEVLPTPCDSNNVSFTNCEGGIGNLLWHMQQSTVPSDVSKTVRISTGNLVGGENGWLSVNGWDNYGRLVDKHYANGTSGGFIHTYGFKEFESGLKQTLTYYNAPVSSFTKYPIVLSNVVCSSVSGDEKAFCDIRREVANLSATVGVLGFINPYVENLSSPGLLKFGEIVPSLKQVVEKNSNYKSFIAIGDGSLDTAKQILDQIPKVKLVIYGRGFGPSRDMSGETFPMQYGNGWIATAGRYATTFGNLTVEISDSSQQIVSVTGNLVNTVYTVGSSVPVNEVTVFAQEVAKIDKPVGKSVFKLEGGTRCWRDECNLGNLVTDAMVHCAYNHVNGTNLVKPIVAIWHGGSLFRDSILGGKEITVMDLHRWLPYHNRAFLVQVSGKYLWDVFSLSASGITADENSAVKDWGQFLQVSNGLEVYYSTKGVNTNVERIRILDEDGGKPVMKDLVTSATYQVVIPSFIKEGRNIYGTVKNGWLNGKDIGFDDTCLQNYINALQMVTVGFEERIYINDPACNSNKDNKKGGNTALTVFLTILFMGVIIAIAYVGYAYVWPKLMGRPPGQSQSFRNF